MTELRGKSLKELAKIEEPASKHDRVSFYEPPCTCKKAAHDLSNKGCKCLGCVEERKLGITRI